MHYVSLIIEFLRGRPAAVFWTVALTQAVLWTLVPAMFYSAPPGEVPMLLAIGHEYVLGSYLGPPLAFWLGDLAFRVGGAPGLYALAQACIVLTYWAVFTLGRRIVGTRHAVLAVLLMVGIAAFAVPSPDFGPAILAAPLWALALLFYWRAVGERERGYWFLLAIALGLLLLASYVGLILIALMAVFTLASPRGRYSLLRVEPWLAVLPFLIVIFPHLAWLKGAYRLVMEGIGESAASGHLSPSVWLCLALVTTHLGLGVLVVFATGWPRRRKERAPIIDRSPAQPFSRLFVYYFALMPAAIAIVIVVASGELGPLDRVAPLVVLSGLAVVVAAGDRVPIYRERMVSFIWFGFLIAPPAVVVFGIMLLPFMASVNLRVTQPAKAEGAFFADTFQRRTGKPLPYVTGDPHLAPLIALGSPSRPHVYFDWAPERSPWASAADIRAQGGLFVWPATDNANGLPPSLRSEFPDLVPEVPHTFTRAIQGLLPEIRLGWAVERPQASAK